MLANLEYCGLGIGTTHCAVRWNVSTLPATPARPQTSWMPVDPLPITAIRRPPRSTE